MRPRCALVGVAEYVRHEGMSAHPARSCSEDRRDAVEETLDSVANEDGVKGLPVGTRMVEETSPDARGGVHLATTASRYGYTTFSTQSMRA